MLSILKIFIRNLNFSFLRQNKNVSIMEMFHDDFTIIKFFSFRMNFLLEDYHHHRITKSYETLKLSTWITIKLWTLILLLILITFCPTNNWLVDCKFFEQILQVQRIDLIFVEVIVISFIEEWLWLFFLQEALTYNCQYLNFITFDFPDDHQKMNLKMKKYLNKYFSIVKFSTYFSYLFVILFSIILWILIIFENFISYQNENIFFIQFLTNIPFLTLLFMSLTYMTGQFFASGSFLLCCLIFFLQKLKQLRMIALSLSSYTTNETSKLVNKRFWNEFHDPYIILYKRISKLNESAKVILVGMEMIAKFVIMSSCVFFSQQIKMNWSNLFIVILGIVVFLCVSVVYMSIATLPTYNEQCFRYILRWLIQSQTQSSIRTKRSKFYSRFFKQIQFRLLIKANLFAQTMVNNQLGFTCGHLFHINKYKFTELILMNIPLILLLYKHASHYEN